MSVQSLPRPEVVDGAWPYFLVNWLAIGAMSATLAVGLMFTGFSIELSGLAISVGYVGIYWFESDT
jgi:hypothetical protein